MARPYSLTEPAGAALPLVVDSPHSGLMHAETLPLAAPPEALLTGWDAYVDQLFAHAPMVGGTLYARAFRAGWSTSTAPATTSIRR
jgi:N-formylglutamate deformylase